MGTAVDEVDLNEYSPINLCALYSKNIIKYYGSNRKTYSFKLDKFVILGEVLKKENINPKKYFDFVFGVTDNSKMLGPKGLCNPILIRDYKQMSTDQ